MRPFDPAEFSPSAAGGAREAAASHDREAHDLASRDDRQWWLGATDVGRYGLVAAAIGAPALAGKWRGAAEAGGAIWLAHRLCSMLKHVVSEERPDGSNDQSFPSSHSLETFAAAASLSKSLGWRFGAPAFAVAGWVAFGRVKAGKHHRHDTVAGALLGLGSVWLTGRATNLVASRLPA